MYNFESREQFEVYLRQSMSQELLDDVKDAVKEAVTQFSARVSLFSAKKNTDERKQVVFAQKQILQTAEEFVTEKPWITYFASVKHMLFLKSQGISSATFDSFVDKEYAQEVDRYAEKLATEAEARIDSDTQTFLQELILLQRAEPLIPQAIRGLTAIIDTPLTEREAVLFPERKKKSLARKLLLPGPSKHEWSIKTIRYFIKALAEQLGQAPEQWMCAPEDTIVYLQELKERRAILESTYLEL